ncbi:MFS general substrate transporter [Rickenella mellea]|uniref:MFS general substrate transporter n=1 Tax=Rickenella mellea TaxID=50990 RepID=A0A4R5XGM8_9AGAM|nr:MFS general substrate transporter [Rickenella mellea]
MHSPAQSLEEKGGAFEKREIVEDASETDFDAQFGGYDERRHLERKLLRKLDIRMSILIFIYILNYIDRNNAASARLRGFEADLKLKGQEFNTLLSILYVGYILMQIPSNMFLNYIGRPSLYMPICMIIWGMISILTGITKNFTGALLTRFFLGFIEAAFFPGALFLLSKWYTREELGLRICILYCGNIISNAFGALLATGILDKMQGKLGHAAWRWLFYIEGALTMVIAVIAIFVLPDFPTTTRWLTPEERALAIRRMEADVGVSDQEDDGNGNQHFEGFFLAVKDWRVWWFAVILTAEVTALSFNAFFPTLTATLGFNRTITLILVAPPFILAAGVAFFVSRHSDKTGERFYHIVVPLAIGIIGFVVAIATMNIAARYVAMFFMGISYSGYIVMFAWLSNTIPRPPAKRAVTLALANCISQLGNIAGSYVWQTKWGLSYKNSYAICISCQGLAILMCWIFRIHLKRLNDKLDRDDERKDTKHKGFRYLL